MKIRKRHLSFCPVYVPLGVPTFHLWSARDRFARPVKLLRETEADFVCPEEMLLSLNALRAFGKRPFTYVFGAEAFPEATVFRIGREPDGSFRFFLAEGEALNRPKQFTGASVVTRTDAGSRSLVEQSVKAGFEPHFAVIRGRHADTLQTLAEMFGFAAFRY